MQEIDVFTQSFIQKSELVHGKRYSYEKSIYKHSKEKVIITCHIHGDFLQAPNSHLRGNGCERCGKESAKEKTSQTLENFILAASEKHNGKYSYNNAIYVNCKSKLLITCSEHGDFLQSPNNHLKGAGCPVCVGRAKFDAGNFVKNAEKVHNFKYDYSSSNVIGRLDKIAIICPEHGIFYQTPKNHLRGCGCPKCANELKASNRAFSQDYFLEKSREVHGAKYSYEKADYKGGAHRVTIICPVHGEFKQLAESHLAGRGCRKCGREELGREMVLSTDEFIRRANNAHKGKYSYDKVEYKKSTSRVIITCPIHGDFKQKPVVHIQGHGCSKCVKGSPFDREKPAILYYLRITHEDGIFYKIGITNRTVEERFKPIDVSKIEVVKTWGFEKGKDAHRTEQMILKECRSYLAGRKDILYSGGNTEIFNIDIFE